MLDILSLIRLVAAVMQHFAFISTAVCYHYNSCCCRYCCCCCCCDRSAGSNCCHLHKHRPFNWLINLHFVQTVASAAEALLLSRWVCMCGWFALILLLQHLRQVAQAATGSVYVWDYCTFWLYLRHCCPARPYLNVLLRCFTVYGIIYGALLLM